MNRHKPIYYMVTNLKTGEVSLPNTLKEVEAVTGYDIDCKKDFHGCVYSNFKIQPIYKVPEHRRNILQ